MTEFTLTKYAMALGKKMKLVPGAKKLLDDFKSQEIPIAIATASGKSNMDFFNRNIKLT